jgi:iron complex transport system substrate-binding protein
LQAEVAAITDAVGTVDTPLRVFNYDSGEDSPFTSGALGMPHTLITLAGGEHIFANVQEDWFTTSWEEIVARNPDVILVSDSAWAVYDDNIAFLKSLPELADVSAIRNERFIPLTYKQATPGLENVVALRTIAQGLYPDKFAEATPK